MRGSFGLLKKPPCIGSSGSSGFGIPAAARNNFLPSPSAYSTSSDGGSGRGRGRGNIAPPHFTIGANHPDRENENSEDRQTHFAPVPPSGAGRGRGKPSVTMPSSSIRPPTPQQPEGTATHGRERPIQPPSESAATQGGGRFIHPPAESDNQTKQPAKPFFFVKDDASGHGTVPVTDPIFPRPSKPIGEASLPQSLMSVLGGTGRGKPGQSAGPVAANQENRHLRRRHIGEPTMAAEEPKSRAPASGESKASATSGRLKLSREDAKKKAMGILSKDAERRGEGVTQRGEGGSGRGRGRGRGRRQGEELEGSGDEGDDDLDLGDDADGEKLAKTLGPDMMEKLTEVFDSAAEKVLPCLEREMQVEGLDTNLQIEFEPEYAMGDFETNPDIEDMEVMPLRETLEKMKPFFMAYEGIQDEAEWQEAIEDTMKRAPLLEKIVEHYCGPERVTAKQQQEELERVAKTLPASAPDPLKRFTDRAVLSLQSNSGWGFHRKCQFMDKLVWEASQSYK